MADKTSKPHSLKQSLLCFDSIIVGSLDYTNSLIVVAVVTVVLAAVVGLVMLVVAAAMQC